MPRNAIPNFFKKPLASWETKNDTTTRIAREIITSEATDASTKLERLRAERLAREAAGKAHQIL